MGKLKSLFLVAALLVAIPTIAVAIQTNSIEVTKDVNQDTAIQVRESGAAATAAIEGVTDLMNRYMTNLRTCEPVHMKQSLDIFGLKMSYQFDINGWVDNKCSYYMTGNIGGLGSDIREVFKVKATDEMIAKIQPVIQCNFTQEQLDVLIDGFVAAQERKVAEKMGLAESKTPTGKQKLSPAEEKMMEMLMSGQACTVPNQEEVMKNFTELMGTLTPSTGTEVTTPSAPSEPVEVNAPSEPAEAPAVEVKPEPVATPDAAPAELPTLRKNDSKVNMPSAPTY